jgi:hypothetical protein
METLLKEAAAVFGASTLFVIVAAWLVKVVLIASLKRESERMLEELKQQGAREIEKAKQQLDIEKTLLTELRTEFMAEQAINRLLSTPGWEKRSFKAIQERIAGFSDDELKRLLVRAGAVQFRRKTGEWELWGLLSRNSLPKEPEE